MAWNNSTGTVGGLEKDFVIKRLNELKEQESNALPLNQYSGSEYLSKAAEAKERRNSIQYYQNRMDEINKKEQQNEQ